MAVLLFNRNEYYTRYLEARRITLIGAMVNAILGLSKIILGITGKSHALLADGIHSIADLTTDLLVIVPARFGSQKAAPSLTLPSRTELLPQLMQCWQGLDGADDIHKITIHYLQGQLHLQVYLPSNPQLDFVSLQHKYAQAIRHIPNIASVEIFMVYEP